MPVTYITADKSLTTPEDAHDDLHDYHGPISDRVSAEVIGIAGDAPSIRRVVLSAETDVSELEKWLGSALVIVHPEA